jgi:hypothetical protein
MNRPYARAETSNATARPYPRSDRTRARHYGTVTRQTLDLTPSSPVKTVPAA